MRAALVALGLFGHVLEAREGLEGLEGLKLIFLCEADLVLCDLEMPGLAGQKILGMNQRDDDSSGLLFSCNRDGGGRSF